MMHLGSSGEPFGKYRLVREIGRGGMGVVYLAIDTNLGREVAIKRLRPGLTRDPNAIEQFRREAMAVAALRHPNIVYINAFDLIDEQFVIEMPYIPGGSLRALLNQGITYGRLVMGLHDSLQALHCCHSQGVIHCDVKPSNLLVDEQNRLCLSDFGVARLAYAQWEETLSSSDSSVVFAGTPQYMCPEAWQGETPTPQFDLYALGMIAREALAGGLPFKGKSPYAFIKSVSETKLPPARTVAPQISDALAHVIDKLIDADPARRFESAEAALAAVECTPEFDRPDETITRTGPLPRTPRPKRTTKRRVRPHRPRPVSWSALLIACVIAGMLGVALGYNRLAGVSEGDPPSATMSLLTQDAVGFERIPTAQTLIDSWQGPQSASRAVYRISSTADDEAIQSALIAGPTENGFYKVLAFTGQSVTAMTLAPESGGGYTVTGTWAMYSFDEGRGTRWGHIAGRSAWNGTKGEPFTLSLKYTSESDPGVWQDLAVCLPDDDYATDTAFLAAFERSPAAQSLVANEVRYRLLARYEEFSAWLPAVNQQAINVAIASDNAAPVLDGMLDDTVWMQNDWPRLRAFPRKSGHRLAAFIGEDALWLALDVAPEAAEIDLAILPATHYPLAESPIFRLYAADGDLRVARRVNNTETPVVHGVESAINRTGSAAAWELRIPWSDLGLTGRPTIGNRLRLNAAAKRNGEILTLWGWPEIEAAWHGALLTINAPIHAGIGE